MGGSATNAAITCSNLGGKAALVTGIGRHRFGDLIREELDRYSVILREIAPEFEGVPAVSSVTIDNAGHRSVVSANANRISVQHNEVDRELLGSTSVLMVDGHFMEVCRTWAEAAHSIRYQGRARWWKLEARAGEAAAPCSYGDPMTHPAPGSPRVLGGGGS